MHILPLIVSFYSQVHEILPWTLKASGSQRPPTDARLLLMSHRTINPQAGKIHYFPHVIPKSTGLRSKLVVIPSEHVDM